MMIQYRWIAMVVLAACGPAGLQDPDLGNGDDDVQQSDPTTERDAAQTASTDAAQPKSSADGGQPKPTDAAQAKPTDAAQPPAPIDGGQSQAKDAAQPASKDAAQGMPKDAAQAAPKDAAQSQPTEPDPLEGLAADWQVRAAGYLERRSSSWLASPPDIANVKCAMSCHTTFAYMLARPFLAPFATTAVADAVRSRLETRVSETVAGTAVPFYGQNTDDKTTQSRATEAVLNAAALALDDIGRGAALSASAKTALDGMWAQQNADGTWPWLEFGLEPWETRDDFGAAIAALVAGSVPANSSSLQAAGTSQLVGYVQRRLDSMVLHDRAMVLYASSKLTTLLQAPQAQRIAADLAATQLANGGFSLGAWGQGSVASSVAQKSDGYATAVAVLALCTGTADGPKRTDVKRALAWLAHNQADDGSWPGQSVNANTEQVKGFMTDAATAYVAIALTLCAQSRP